MVWYGMVRTDVFVLSNRFCSFTIEKNLATIGGSKLAKHIFNLIKFV